MRRISTKREAIKRILLLPNKLSKVTNSRKHAEAAFQWIEDLGEELIKFLSS